MTGLKPCPFCDAFADFDTNLSYRNIRTKELERSISVYCTECGANITICVKDVPDITLEQVVTMWNTRT